MLRTVLLNKLINMESPVEVIASELNKFPWDCEDELVTLTRENIHNALKNFHEGKVNQYEIENWADAIENREDIGREEFYSDVLNEILYELANPLLTEKLTKPRAETLIKKLK
jgi:hypothetical protein